MNTLPLSIPPPRDKVGFIGEMKGIIRNRLLFQWDGGLGSFFYVLFISPRVGVYVLLGDFQASQLFPCINYV